MRRLWGSFVCAAALAVVAIACSGHNASPTTPSNGGGSGGSGGGGATPPPAIDSITPSSTRVEVGTPITLTAALTGADAATVYKWSATTGTFTGSGATVTWQPSADAATPADYTITLTVSEGASTATASKALTVHVNNSQKELADLSMRFLTNFAHSDVSPATCVSEFSDSCSGKKDELSDITDNRHDFEITDYTLRPTGVSIASSLNSATVHTFCAFTSKVITTSPVSGGCLSDPNSCKYGSTQSVQGDCYTTDVYEGGVWKLCTSHFAATAGSSGFAKAFFGRAFAVKLP